MEAIAVTDKLAFRLDVAPERGTILPIKMDRERWLDLASKNNDLRIKDVRRCWYHHEMVELYDELHA